MSNVDRTSYIRAVVISALMFTAMFVLLPIGLRWVAAIAGFSVGYLSFRFRDVLHAIPQAIEKTGGTLKETYHSVVYASPLVHLVWFCTLVGAGLCFITLPLYSDGFVNSKISTEYVVYVLTPLVYMLYMMVAGALAFRLIELGANHWEGFFCDTQIIEKPLTYGNVLRWFAEGILFVVAFLVVMWWIKLLRWLAPLVRDASVFIWNLIVLIHAKERILAGIDGIAGGALACWWLKEPTMSIVSLAVLFVGSACIGALIGIVHFWLAQKIRIRFVQPVAA